MKENNKDNITPYKASQNLNTVIGNPTVNINDTMDINIKNIETNDLNKKNIESNKEELTKNNNFRNKINQENKHKKKNIKINLSPKVKVILLVVVVILVLILLFPILAKMF